MRGRCEAEGAELRVRRIPLPARVRRAHRAPRRDPDLSCALPTRKDQALLYRLTGDRNPLHADPGMAADAGFGMPILHGLCTFGHCSHMLLDALAGGDPARFRKIKVRFSSPVMLNDTLTVKAWHDGVGRVIFEANVDGKVVVSNAYFEFDAPTAGSTAKL